MHALAVVVTFPTGSILVVWPARPPLALILLGEGVALLDQPLVATALLGVEHFAAKAQALQAFFHARDFGGRAGGGIAIVRRMVQQATMLLKAFFKPPNKPSSLLAQEIGWSHRAASVSP